MTELYPADRHEPLSALPWEAGAARAEIELIVTDARASVDDRGLWATHPKDRDDGSPRLTDLYFGAGAASPLAGHR
ncbi:hypothetical protein [Phenylobacterium ferrooxidans]|uniref:Uncharacterized protein n=1 Tax=Phenylobacterium ferrooxidans TaxID=2982689 RepID=A0ABW6CW15_9CAUL